MIGHGQVEGYSEKYGMEFRRALWDEKPDPDLVARHSRQIFPLLHRRWLFAGIEHFHWFDLLNDAGQPCEDVYAYTNNRSGQSALVVYQNRFAETGGRLHFSSPMLEPMPGDNRPVRSKTQSESLELPVDANLFVTCRDSASGLEHLFSCQDIAQKGLPIHLAAYQTHVFIDFHCVADDDKGSYRRLWLKLDGAGVYSIQEALEDLRSSPQTQALRDLLNPAQLETLHYAMISPGVSLQEKLAISRQVSLTLHHLSDVIQGVQSPMTTTPVSPQVKALFILSHLSEELPFFTSPHNSNTARWIEKNLSEDMRLAYQLIMAVLLVRNSSNFSKDPDQATFTWIEERQLIRVLDQTCSALNVPELTRQSVSQVVKVWEILAHYFSQIRVDNDFVIVKALSEPVVQAFIGFQQNEQGIQLDPGGFEQFLWWLFALLVTQNYCDQSASSALKTERVMKFYDYCLFLGAVAEKQQYLLEEILKFLSQP
jgi:hypothetical protein